MTALPSDPTPLAFVGAALVTTVVPGPNIVYIVGTGIGSGRRTAVAAALGVEGGTLVHIVASVLGLSALLSSSPLVFAIALAVDLGYAAGAGSPGGLGWRAGSPRSPASCTWGSRWRRPPAAAAGRRSPEPADPLSGSRHRGGQPEGLEVLEPDE